MKIVVVGFKVKEENSVYYVKYNFELENSLHEQWSNIMGRLLEKAYKSGSEFVSVRFIE